jgi:adenosylcobinamide-GDP ribazoletransferase
VAVVVLIVLLLLKFASLEALVAQGEVLPLVLAPLIGRTTLLALFLSTPYVRPGGLGEVLTRELPRQPTLVLMLSAGVAILLIAGRAGAWLLASACITFAALRVLMLRRLGGTTGDTAGAMVELVESSVLVTAAMV